jgi:hypothetical protein
MDKVRFGGYFTMKKLASVLFVYDDGSQDEIIDPRASLMFQSRCNSSGILSGLEDWITHKEANEPDVK